MGRRIDCFVTAESLANDPEAVKMVAELYKRKDPFNKSFFEAWRFFSSTTTVVGLDSTYTPKITRASSISTR